MASYFLLFSIIFSFHHFTSAALPSIGVTYSTVPTTVSPPPDKISTTISAMKITNVRLPNADPPIIKAFSFTNTSLLLSIPNPLLPSLASNHSFALR
ncbi:hypothetical protein REPUB_Repub03eG0222700 [Reevesia pubescens]